MTKIVKFLLAIVAICAITSTSLSAQKLGFIAGPSLNNGNILTADSKASFLSIPGGGGHAGMMFEYDVNNRWGFDFYVMYELRTMRWNLDYQGVDTTTIFKRQVGYFNVPFHFYVNFPLKNDMRLSLFGGPVFTCGLHGTDWAWLDTDTRRPVTYAQSKIFDKDDGRIVRCEIAAEVGLALKWNNWQGRIGYQYSFNNSTAKSYLYTLPMASKTINYLTQGTLKLSVAYLFDLRK